MVSFLASHPEEIASASPRSLMSYPRVCKVMSSQRYKRIKNTGVVRVRLDA